MNAKRFTEAMGELDDKYIDEVLSYRRASASKIRPKRFGLFDPWFQKPSNDPIRTVQSAIEGQAEKEYTVFVRIDEIAVDKSETERIISMYAGSDLAKERGWTDEFLAEHFLVVRAKYYVEYDHTKTFMDDGTTRQYFYLVQDVKTGEWKIIDNTSPNTGISP